MKGAERGADEGGLLANAHAHTHKRARTRTMRGCTRTKRGCTCTERGRAHTPQQSTPQPTHTHTFSRYDCLGHVTQLKLFVVQSCLLHLCKRASGTRECDALRTRMERATGSGTVERASVCAPAVFDLVGVALRGTAARLVRGFGAARVGAEGASGCGRSAGSWAPSIPPLRHGDPTTDLRSPVASDHARLT